MKNFQIIIIIVFIAAAVLGIMVFSGTIPLGHDKGGATGTVVLWGTTPASMLNPVIEDFNRVNTTFVLKYFEKNKDTFDRDLLEALAEGTGPDLFLLPDYLAYGYRKKIFTIPYQSYPEASFKNNFTGAGEVFLTSNGIMAFPIAVDPLVMYYNRSILDANDVVYPPTYWEDFIELIPKLTKKNETNKIEKSTVAMGQFANVAHAKDIISLLFMQAGNKVVYQNEESYTAALAEGSKYNLASMLKFYTDFADPLASVYSWNKSLPSSTDDFSKEDLAFYFGYGSELRPLINKNPNQNFLVAPMPQIKGSGTKMTSAHTIGVAISSASKNFNSAFIAASLLATSDFPQKFAEATGTVPARRDLLAQKRTDAYTPILYSSALFGKTWLDPDKEATDNIFKGMVEKVLANTLTPSEAILDANSKLSLLLAK